MCAINPVTIGAKCWNEVPTIRGIMQMTISNQWSFPSNNIADICLFSPKLRQQFQTNSSSLISKSLVKMNQAMVEEEKTFFSQQRAPWVSQDYPDGFVIVDEVIARHPPASVIRELQELNKEIRMGVRLRQCR